MNSRSRSRSISRSRSASRSSGRSRSPTRSPSPRSTRGEKRSRHSRRSYTRSRSRSDSRSRSPRGGRSSSRRGGALPPPSRGGGPRTMAVYHKPDSDARMPKSRGGWNSNAKRENPDPNRILGVFNLSMHTTEKDLRRIFGEYGDLDKIDLVYDHPTGRSRGFGFVYFKNLDDAVRARDKLQDIEIDGRRIRVDFSVTKRAHSPTPGHYMGFTPRGGGPPRGFGGPSRGYGGGFYGGGGGGYGRDYRHYRDSYASSSRRSPSPRHRSSYGDGYADDYGRRHRSRSRSPVGRSTRDEFF